MKNNRSDFFGMNGVNAMKIKRIAHLIIGTVLLAAGSFSAQAATATFSDMNSGNGTDLLFSVTGTTVDGLDGNILHIGLNGFKATSGGAPTALVDSFSVNIAAPTGFYITSIDYAEVYSYLSGTGVTAITLSVVANGAASNPASAAFAFSDGSNVGISIPTIVYGPGVEMVSLSISNSLFAFALSDAVAIEKLSGTLSVGLTPVPLPPALGLLGAALIGLTTIGKRRNRAA